MCNRGCHHERWSLCAFRVTCETYIATVTVCIVVMWIVFGLTQIETPHDEHTAIVNSFTVLKPKATSDIQCVQTQTRIAFTMCPLPSGRSHVSFLYRKRRLWQSHLSRSMEKALDNYPDAAVIDVGVHDGYHSMMAASRGHQVLAVETSRHVASYLRHSLHVDKPKGHVTLLHHSLADNGVVALTQSVRKFSHFTKVKKNDAKVIYLDDLLPMIESKNVIIKLDVDGRECKAWHKSQKFFATKTVPYMFIAWHKMAADAKKQSSACNSKLLHRMVRHLNSRGYTAHDVERLNKPANVTRPVHFMLMTHKSATPLTLH